MASPSPLFIASVVIAAIGCGLAGSATGNALYTSSQDVGGVTFGGSFTMWQVCVRTGDQTGCTALNLDGACSGAKSQLMAARAFAILSCLAFGGSAILLGLRSFGNQVLPKPIYLAGWGACLLCSLIAWPLMLSFATVPQCDSEKSVLAQDGVSLGPGPILMIVAWLAACGGLGFEFMIPAGAGGADGANNNEMSVNAGVMSYGNAKVANL